MSSFFNRYPTFTYADSTATNIFIRTAIRDAIKNKVTVFFPYTITEGERPDIIAQDYYGSSKYDWLIYFANNIIDPYYEWPLSNYDFYAYIINKYGSVDEASQRIAFWRVNFSNDDSIISTSAYELLNKDLKKYWTVDADFGTGFVRKALDTTIETNKVIEVEVSSSEGFAVGDRITQSSGGDITATGFISLITDNTLVCRNILGEFVPGLDCTNKAVVSAVVYVNTIATNISYIEQPYWEYVTQYDYENELNEQRKHIQIIDKSFVLRIEKELRELINE